MLRHHLKTSLRNIRKNKGFTALNIIGLATGIASCLLIVLYVMDELSYDKFNLKADRIYRVGHNVKFGDNHIDLAQAPAGMGPETVREFPQVEQYTRLQWHDPILIKKGNENLRELKVAFADSTLFDVFTLPLVAGNAKTALVAPGSLVINETMALKYFNTTDAVGRQLLLNNKDSYTITAVIKDIPEQSHFNFEIFLPMIENEDSRHEADGWVSENYNTYLLLKKGVNMQQLMPELDKMLTQHVAPLLQSMLNVSLDNFTKQGNYVRNNMTPLTAIHLHSAKLGELRDNGNIVYVYIFSAITVFLLLIACVNFINLSTARAADRAKEVGVRKVLGSLKKNLVLQFLTESLLVTGVALLLALLLAMVLLPWFNGLSGKTLQTGLLFQPSMLVILILLLLMAGLLAGSYPAFVLSSFQPVKVLKGTLAGGFKRSWLRNALVVFQFAISIVLIASTIIINSQLNYIRNKDIGFNRHQVLIIQNTNVLGNQAAVFKNELLHMTGVTGATMTGYLPVNGDRSSDAFFQTATLDSKTSVLMQKWKVDEDYLPVFDIKLSAGRNFQKDLATDSNAVLINEAAAKMLGGGALINKKIYRINVDNKGVIMHHIIGVVKNFNFNSLRDMITPLTLRLAGDNDAIAVRIQSADAPATLQRIKNAWKNLSATNPFTYSFMDDAFNSIYDSEQRTGKLFVTFATLAIVIACLGLFGLAAYAARARNREIGIRKVLGASTRTIISMLSGDFLKLVIVAALIACPLAWWAMHNWLQDFAYRVSIHWWVFLIAAVMALLIAFVTVIFQSLKAAVANPVNSLRSE